ncbi:MAG: toll/interleukin-1 receptor domain-containing protein [Egibacteraceae bacterium]
MERVGFDVFLSYNCSDEAAVTHLAELLREQGIQPWLDRWALTPGGGWQQEIVQGLHASRTCAVILGPQGLSDWAREELGVAHDRAAKDRGFRLFMVLLPGAVEPNDPSLAFLRSRTWVDLRAAIDDPNGLRDLTRAITSTTAPRAQGLPPNKRPVRTRVWTGDRTATAALTIGVVSVILGVLPITAP